MFVALEVFDQRCTAAHIGLLQVRRGCGRRRRCGSSAAPPRWCRRCPHERARDCRGTTFRHRRNRRTCRRTGRSPRQVPPKALHAQRCRRPRCRRRSRRRGRRRFRRARSQVPRSVDEAALSRREEPAATGFRAAVDGDVVPGDECRLVGGEEQRDARLVLGPSHPPDRRPRRPQVVDVLVAGQVVDLRRLRQVGADAVDADAVSAEIDGKTGGEVRGAPPSSPRRPGPWGIRACPRPNAR